MIDNVAYGLEVQGVAQGVRRQRAAWCSRPSASGVGAPLSAAALWRHAAAGRARGLVLDPEVLFFDEPFSALDPLIRRDMQAELIALQNRRPRTIVFITHDFDEALRLGDRIAIMKDGVLDQVGTPEEVVARPATDYVREFTTDVPQVEVLTVRSVMHDGETNGVRRVPAHTKIGQLIPLLLDSGDPICVVDEDGRPLRHRRPRERSRPARRGVDERRCHRRHDAGRARRPAALGRAGHRSRSPRRVAGAPRMRSLDRFVDGFPDSLYIHLADPIDDLQDWIQDNRLTSPLFTWFLEPFRNGVDSALDSLTDFFLALPWFTLPVVVFALVARTGRWRSAIFAAAWRSPVSSVCGNRRWRRCR